MPRPSKRVSPNTLGGMIRSARQNLHLSLAEVAREKYSTSLISQIERNRIDTSAESLQYLAEQLKLPLDDLTLLAQQSRDTGAEESKIKSLDEKRVQAAQMLADNRPRRALDQLQDLNMSSIPPFFLWRLVALPAQCYFTLPSFHLTQHALLSPCT